MTHWPIADLVPHAGDVILLDEVLGFDAESLRARAVVRASGPFHLEDGTLPNWLGLEFMAQAVAAWAGCQARAANQPVELGFLLGTRRYECTLAAFTAGMVLDIEVVRSLQDDSGMGVFECRIFRDGAEIAVARLNVYRPRDVNTFVQEPLASQGSQPH
ncbi:3-hydroxylacyl-ACP dehydratase [Bordetella genomosp. 1]|uniref:3-hydroxylacyl-ACP dehydratase n=1 Tax=Bordetella genomosp. 1 TaxID=1395607 RepID=A0A261SG43_9BORD|nr:hotdog family protein [Bordetella genomosp. 1]OZI35780.1 3-hydroxylacyl-ACP dehydratase [Bordetella genomosp. 1]